MSLNADGDRGGALDREAARGGKDVRSVLQCEILGVLECRFFVGDPVRARLIGGRSRRERRRTERRLPSSGGDSQAELPSSVVLKPVSVVAFTASCHFSQHRPGLQWKNQNAGSNAQMSWLAMVGPIELWPIMRRYRVLLDSRFRRCRTCPTATA